MRPTFHRTVFTLTISLAVALLNVPAQAQVLPPAHPAAPSVGAQTVVLYDQMDAPGSNFVTSQNFEFIVNNLDSEAADDFTVPAVAGGSWGISTVEISGQYSSSPATVKSVDSVSVRFYTTTLGLPFATPFSSQIVTPTSGLASGSFVLSLPISVVVAAGGNYWVSVQANKFINSDGKNGGGQWYWNARATQSSNPAAWRTDPADGWGTGCTSWKPLVSVCWPDSTDPDLLFRISGVSLMPNPAPVLSNLTPAGAVRGLPFTLTVDGANFVGGSKVQWDGAVRTTTFISGTRLTAAISGADVPTLGAGHSVTVYTDPALSGGVGGGLSNAMILTVTQDSYPLSIDIAGGGFGTITRAPDQPTYANGSVVTLTATPVYTSTFTRWIGTLNDFSSQTTVVVNGATVVTATFAPITYTLTLHTAGNGLGTIGKNPDQAGYIGGSQVLLTANPSPTSTFSGWSGAVSGLTNPILVPMDSDQEVTATFTALVYHTLDIRTAGNGLGTVAKNPDLASYPAGAVVTLTASPSPTSTFSGWSGAASGLAAQTTVVMNADQIVTATFTALVYHTLDLRLAGSGLGSVSKSPDQVSYAAGAVVTLTASPNPTSTFSGWSGAASGLATQTTVVMNADQVVTATFTANPPGTFGLTLYILGLGSVLKNPDQTTYAAGTLVTLTASPAPTYTFSGWSGAASGLAAQTTITLDANKIVTATFAPIYYTLDLRTTGPGFGSVSKQPNQSSFLAGTLVTLTATPSLTSTFSAWSGALSGALNPATVLMNANKTVTATFEIGMYLVYLPWLKRGP